MREIRIALRRTARGRTEMKSTMGMTIRGRDEHDSTTTSYLILSLLKVRFIRYFGFVFLQTGFIRFPLY